MAGKVFVKTHGCQMNEYDSAKMLDVLAAAHGMQLAPSADEADVLLLNTCSIREKAQEKVFSQLGQWRELKEQRPELIIGVGGCVASQRARLLPLASAWVRLVSSASSSLRKSTIIDTRG